MSDPLTTPTVGLTSRQGTRGVENDDHATWFTVPRPDRHCLVHIGVVADGVTSTSAGAQASRIATEAIEATLREPPDPQETLSEWLAGSIRNANEEILFEGKRNPEWQGMSTTVVLAALAGRRLYILHLGDSRAYLHRNGHLHQLTTDHTWAQAAVNAGTMTAAEAAHHPGRNQLQRYLGGRSQITVARGLLAPGTNLAEEYLWVEPGDRVLLCSDGIYHRLEHESLATIISREDNPQHAVDALIAAAIAQGEIDDMTAILFTVPIQLESDSAADTLVSPVATNAVAADDEVTVKASAAAIPQPPATPQQTDDNFLHRLTMPWSSQEIGLLVAVVLFVAVAIYLFGH